MIFNVQGRTYKTEVWSSGIIGELFAFDTETALIIEGEVPPFVLAQAYAGGDTVFFIPLDRLSRFFDVHKSSYWTMHNAAFDMTVVEHEVGVDFYHLIRGQRIYDICLEYRLIQLAKVGACPRRWSLAFISQEILNLKLDKNEDIRLNFGRYRTGDKINYKQIPPAALEYAAIDAIATFQIHTFLAEEIRKLDPAFHLSHNIQLMGAIGLHHVELNGIGFDLAQKEVFLASIQEALQMDEGVLHDHGYIKGQKGNKKAYEKVICDLGLTLPSTPSGRNISAAAEHLEEYRNSIPFIAAHLDFNENQKLKNSIEKIKGKRVHTRFNALLNTGRTSSSSPNIQNLPRREGVRECFVPRAGHCFLIIDYSQLELCTLAQVCFDQFGHSKMRELINAGRDLHIWFASQVTGRAESDFTKDSPERQWAKAVNFGFPGGLGAKAFVDLAKKTYGISDMTENRAKNLKDQWQEAFPETAFYLKDNLLNRADFSSLEWCKEPEIAVAMFKRIISGEVNSKSTGRPYNKETLDWAFKDILPQLAPDLPDIEVGSPELIKQVLLETVTTRTGRTRANATYCQARNTPFQGLAADGAKIALYRLVKAGYRVVNFIHDEYIIEIPIDSDFAAVGADVDRIIVDGMTMVVPDVIIRTEWSITDRWYKKSKLMKDPITKNIRIFTGADRKS